MIKLLATLLIALLSLTLTGQVMTSTDPADVWASRKMQGMTLDQKIGQLFMIRAYSKGDKAEEKTVSDLVSNYHIGGICFFQGTPETQARNTNTYQAKANVPLFIAMDAEWGLGMRFPKTTQSFPKQLTLGAIEDNNLIYDMGLEVARQLKSLGVNVNFAPVVDINNNPNNPVINYRSFGEDLYNVGAKSYAYARGMQEGGLVACAKHFPGHGDTDVDSHYDLPVLKMSRERIDSLELAPFKMLSELGIKSMMSAHLHVPAIDDRPNRPTTLSSAALNGILRDEIGYDGLVFTDAMDMQGVAKHFAPGEAELEALIAGNDVLLLPRDVKKAISTIKTAVTDGRVTTDRINQSVFRILKAKYEVNLTTRQIVSSPAAASKNINTIEGDLLKRVLTEKSLTLAKNAEGLVPVRRLQDKKFSSLALGSDQVTTFQKRLESYAQVNHHHVGKTISIEKRQSLLNTLSSSDIVFVSIHDMDSRASKDYGISQDQMDLIFALSSRNKVVLTLFGSPYSLKYFNGLNTLLVAYEDHDIAQDKAAQALFGVFSIEGKLPVTASSDFPYGTQVITSNLQRMGYDIPERVGINSSKLAALDSLINDMITRKAAPGCQILVAKDRKIIHNKSYGYHTYRKSDAVENTDLYDVASVTKILSTTIGLMSLKDKNMWDEKMPLKVYLPDLDTTDKSTIIGEDVLGHQARLAGWIPFYKNTMEEDGKDYKEGYYTAKAEPGFDMKVCDDLYMCNSYVDSIRNRIYSSELRDTDSYRYSDLGFYLFKDVIEAETGFTLDRYSELKFYRPMGLNNIGFNPIGNYPLDDIVPSEDDNYFRNGKVHGYVHDMGAAMLGGVAGHAGLFSNAEDLSVLMQMLLNGGSYGGYEYLKAETIKQFTTRYKTSKRRGLGFDMKQLDPKKTENMAEEASPRTFGHLGFTGAAVWADPEYDLIFIFLSNRTYPSMENSVFSKKNYRPKAMSIVYNAMDDYTPTGTSASN